VAELKFFHKVLIFIAVVISLVELTKLCGKMFNKKTAPKIPPMQGYDSVPEAMVRRYGCGFRDDGTPQKVPNTWNIPARSDIPKSAIPMKTPASYPRNAIRYTPTPQPVTISTPEPAPEREIFYIRGLD
jgi:hypothetical protein